MTKQSKKQKHLLFNNAKRLFRLLTIILPLTLGQSSAAVYPQDFNYSSRIDALLDAGFIWNHHSLFHPLSCDDCDSSGNISDSLGAFRWLKNYRDDFSRPTDGICPIKDDNLHMLFMPGIGLGVENGKRRAYDNLALQSFIWWQAQYQDNWYARMYIRATNEAKSLAHYTGTYEAVERAGFKMAETDQAVIGFKSDWFNIEYGRTREIWGTNNEDNLIFSGSAPAYDRLMIQFSKKKITYRYFYAFLETYSEGIDINRYVVGRCLEYTNHQNLLLGISESTVFAGPNRPLDLAYLNPIGFALDIDLNNRSNFTENYDNSIWGLYLDWLALSNLRVSCSIAIDEFQIDKKDRNEGTADGLGYFGRISWTPYYKPYGITFFLEGMRLDTYFGQHQYGSANLVSRGIFMGHPIGNDADKISLGSRWVFPMKIILELESGRYRWGDNSLLKNPYVPYDEFIRTSFPSGEVRRNDFLEIRIDAQPFKNLIVNISGHVDLNNSGENSALERYTINLIYLFPFIREY